MLRLIKTSDGSHGAPRACKECQSFHFIKAGISWHCSKCGTYVPAELKPLSTDKLRKDFDTLIKLHKELRFQLEELERIVT